MVNGLLKQKKQGLRKGVQVCKGGPRITHPIFADDLLLFGEGTMENTMVMADIIHRFCMVSGQKVNTAKSKIFVSKNVKN